VKLRFHCVVAAVVLAVSAATVGAQAPASPRQPQGLFGGVRPDASAKTRLDFTTSVIEGYDSDVPASLRPAIDPSNLQTGGLSTVLSTSAAYSWKSGRSEVAANGNSVFRHYADLGQVRGVGSSFGAGVSVRLPGHMTLLANQAAAYTPAYLSGLFPTGATIEPGSPGDTAPDYTVSNFTSYTYSSTLSLKHDFNERSSFLASGEFQYTDRQAETPLWQDVSGHWLNGEYSRKVSRNTGITARYRYRSGAFGYTNELQTMEHALEFGMSYSKPLSATRRASFRFSFGASGADVPQSVAGGNLIFRQYMGNGYADVEYQFQGTWRARANYKRGIEYVVDIPEPVYADSISVGIDGFVTRRIDLAISGGYSSGDSILNSSELAYATYTGNIRARYAITRLAAIYGEYLYYFYDFAEGTPLLVGVPPGLERHGVRVGFSLWMPALRK